MRPRAAFAVAGLSLTVGCVAGPPRTGNARPATAEPPQSAGPPGSVSPAPPNAPLPSRATSELVKVSVTENLYNVPGDHSQVIRAELNRRGPLDRDGARHDAYTGWYVDWKYPYARSSRGCTTGRVSVTVHVTYTLPRWIESAGSAAHLQRKWARYMAKLRAHEDGHRDIGVHAGEDIKRRMEAYPPQPTCGALEMAADSLGNRLLDLYRRVERNYDADTKHGATQGASFP